MKKWPLTVLILLFNFSSQATGLSCHQLFEDVHNLDVTFGEKDKSLALIGSERKSDYPIDISRDIPENDPSIKNLTLKEQIPQTTVAALGIDKHIDQIVDDSFAAARLVLAEDGYNFKDSFIESILSPIKDRYKPQVENGLSFINSDAEFKHISDRKFGYCWGLSTLNKYMTSLAFFDNSLPRNPLISFYKNKIDQIISGHATVIPGFKNIAELALVPEIELYLKLNSASLWASRAVRGSSVNVIKELNRKMTKSESQKLFDDLTKRLQRGEFPKIMFSALIPSKTYLGINADMHVTLVYKIEKKDDMTRVYLWDNNFYAQTLIDSPKYIDFLPNGDIKFEPWYEAEASYSAKSDLLSRVMLAPEQDAENLQILGTLKKFCSNPANKKFCTGKK